MFRQTRVEAVPRQSPLLTTDLLDPTKAGRPTRFAQHALTCLEVEVATWMTASGGRDECVR
jgi:hypothetical protein